MNSTNKNQLFIAVAIGICIGLMLGSIVFSTHHHSSESSSLSSTTKVVCPSFSPSSPLISSKLKPTNLTPKINSENEDEETKNRKPVPRPTTRISSSSSNSVSVDFSFSSSIWDCSSLLDVPEIRSKYANQDEKIFSKDTLHRTVDHFSTMMKILNDANFRSCWRKILGNRRTNDKKSSNSGKQTKFFFYDLGSRKLDQTHNFLQLYPGAKKYNIICFEPNPTFNSVYVDARNRGNNKNIYHMNAAVGIAKDSLRLTNRHVGSSIVKEVEKKNNNVSKSDNNNDNNEFSHIVRVLPFLDAILGERHGDKNDVVEWKGYTITNGEGAKESSSSSSKQSTRLPLPESFRDKIVVKMDVEKAEFAILHHLVRTGALSLISELLLECHYNTNLPREKRDPKIHIGYDDCVNLVNSIRDASGGSMEVVLWNSMKTAQRTGRGYIERHGGFYPT